MDRDESAEAEEATRLGGDVGREALDEPAPAYRHEAPDYLSPIDASAPVSGHVPAPAASHSAAETPEHDWSLARGLVYPALRPVGTQGEPLDDLDRDDLGATGKTHTQPLTDEGPAGLVVVYALDAGAYDIIVNGDHVRSWGISADDLRDAALANLAAWSSSAPWTDEVSGERRLVSSDTGDGWDAVRILLPDVRAHLTEELAAAGRILIGLPERHVLLAGSLRPDDRDFAALFAEFVVEHSGAADEPIDRRVFELVDGELVPYAPTA